MAKKVDFAGHRVRPAHVTRAIVTGDTEKCREYGRRGAETRRRLAIAKKAARNHAMYEAAKDEAFVTAAYAVRHAEAQAEEFRLRDEEANLHICPLD